MNSYEKNIDDFLELIIGNKMGDVVIDKTYRYNKPSYIMTLNTDVDHNMISSVCSITFNIGKVAVYIRFVPHRNEVYLERDDCDSICIDSKLLTDKYTNVIEALYHKLNNDNVLEYINTSVEYLELKEEYRDVKIKKLDEQE